MNPEIAASPKAQDTARRCRGGHSVCRAVYRLDAAFGLPCGGVERTQCADWLAGNTSLITLALTLVRSPASLPVVHGRGALHLGNWKTSSFPASCLGAGCSSWE